MTKKRIWALVLPFAVAMYTVPAFAQDDTGGGDTGGGDTGGGDTGGGDTGGTDAGGGDTGGTDAGGGDTGGGDAGGTADAGGGTMTDMAAPGMYTKDNWPGELVKRPITNAKGQIEIRGDILINLSKSLVGKPVSIAPDIYYGVSDKLSVGLVHGTGICITGKKNGCAKAYNDVGLDAIFAFMTGNFGLGAHGGIVLTSLDPMFARLNVGVLGKYMAGKLAVVFDPRIGIGLTKRDVGNKEDISVPVEVQFQATPKLAALLDTGIGGPTSHFGDFYAIPLGVGALFNMNKLDVGLRFTFPNIGGKGHSADFRVLDLFVNFRM